MQLEYDSITVRFARYSSPSVTLMGDGQTYITAQGITVSVYGIIRHQGHIYDNVTYTLARTNDCEYWTLNAGSGTLVQTYSDRTEIPEDIIKAIELFEENFS